MHGEIQPIGDVNLKIEGFWEIYRARQAKGEQRTRPYGVLIPAANVGDLMLRREVATAIANDDWFHIYPISTVDEGLALLTGVSAAQVHALANRRLYHFHQLAMQSKPTRPALKA